MTLAGATRAAPFEHDYGDALGKSLLFYEAQRSGAHHAQYTWKVSWRQAAALGDGDDVGVDLSGGWFDAGDYVKFGLPMAYSASIVGWGLLEFSAAYERAGELTYGLDNLRFVLDYLSRLHRTAGTNDLGDDRFFHQVGDAYDDHAYWGPPESMSMSRPTAVCTSSKPCTEVVAGAAAALATGSLVFANRDPDYSRDLLTRAREAYAFADAFRGSSGYHDAAGAFYASYSGWDDELAWAAIWLYRATGDADYLHRAQEHLGDASDNHHSDTISWDNTFVGTTLLLAQTTGDEKYRHSTAENLEFWTDTIPTTPGGLAFLRQWGSLRYAANAAWIALVYAADIEGTNGADAAIYRDFALTQLNYILGSNPRGSSYVVGFGDNPPTNPHHAAAHASPSFSIVDPKDNVYELTGALVGGPGSKNDWDWEDDRQDFVRNEVTTSYNAGFTSALAAIITLEHGLPRGSAGAGSGGSGGSGDAGATNGGSGGSVDGGAGGSGAGATGGTGSGAGGDAGTQSSGGGVDGNGDSHANAGEAGTPTPSTEPASCGCRVVGSRGARGAESLGAPAAALGAWLAAAFGLRRRKRIRKAP